PDHPLEGDFCGGCQKCLDACPSSALCRPRVLDARRCLSYWTIENRDALEPDIMRTMGNRLFGCDTCQEVCPFNQRQLCGPADQMPVSAEETEKSLAFILRLNSNREFEKAFAGT